MNDTANTDAIEVDGYREARLDQILAQELYADMAFAGWLWRRAGGSDHADPTATNVRMNCDDMAGMPADALGETDVWCTLQFPGGERQLLIENKIFAPFQPSQPQRYRRRAEAVGGRALLVAPSSYPASSEARREFHGVVAVEEIAEFIENRADRRSVWLAQLLRGLVRRPGREPSISDPATEAFTAYCCEWLNGSGVVPAPNSLRTLGQGWLSFETPSPMIYKVVGVKGAAMVDVYVKELPFDERAVLDRLSTNPCIPDANHPEERFDQASDSKQNVVLRYKVSQPLTPASGVPVGPDLEVLHSALVACRAMGEWLRQAAADLVN